MVSSSRKRRQKVTAHARPDIFRDKIVKSTLDAVRWAALSFLKELASKVSAIAVGALVAWVLHWWGS